MNAATKKILESAQCTQHADTHQPASDHAMPYMLYLYSMVIQPLSTSFESWLHSSSHAHALYEYGMYITKAKLKC